MKTLYFILFLFSLVAIHPVTAQKVSKEEKAIQLEKAFQATQKLIAGKHFQVDINRVYPQSGHDLSRFNPQGTITVTDRVAQGHLPFFGRAYSLPYGEGGGIEFDAPMKDPEMKVIEKKKKKSISYKFSVPAKNGNDVYQFTLDIAPDGNCLINMNSNNKTHISYSGMVTEIVSPEKK